MIIDKNKKPPVDIKDEPTITEVEVYDTNALCEVYKAVKKILLTIKEDPADPNSQPYFKTIKMDNGQLARLTKAKANNEYGIAFPAVFVHFINVRYLIQQSRIGEGRATLRLHFVLNRMNNSDDDFELEGYEMFNRINQAVNDNLTKFPALAERFQLTYFEQPLSFDNALQPFWIDYEVWFSEYSGYKYKKYVERYIVVPPFTNHSDQLEKHRNGHEDHKEPTIDDVSHVIYPTE